MSDIVALHIIDKQFYSPVRQNANADRYHNRYCKRRFIVIHSKYWNPLLETLALNKLRALQLRKFKAIFTWAYNHSKFHRSLYDSAGIKPEDIRTTADIRRVPKVEKAMMRGIQQKDPFPYGDALCVPLEEVTVFRQTSGTTGQPVYQPDTWQDWEWWAECWSFILWAQGYRQTDRVFIPFGYNVFVAFWAGHYAAEKIGCEVVQAVSWIHRPAY